MRKKIILRTVFGILLVLLAGGLIAQRQLSRECRALLTERADRRLMWAARAADESLAAALGEYAQALTAAAEQSGAAGPALEELARLDGVAAVFEIRRDGSVVSPEALPDLRLAPGADPRGAVPCLDGAGRLYLALTEPVGGGRFLAAALDLEALCARTPFSEAEEGLVLLDPGGTTLVYWQDGRLWAELAEEGPETALPAGDSPGSGSVTLDGEAVRLAVIPAGSSRSGLLSVGAWMDLETVLAPADMVAAAFWVCGAMVAAAGAALALGVRAFGKTRRYRRELEILQERNRAAEELNRKSQQLAHVQRLELLGTLTSSISHEFNNLLSPIMGYSMLALEKLPPEQTEVYDDLLEIYNASRKAKTLVRRLSDLSRKHPETVFRPLSPDALVRKVMSVARPARPENITVHLDLACGEETTMVGGEMQLTQILLNLVLNAFDAMEEGGELTVSTQLRGEDVLFTVSDTGPGITPENLPHIFDPFFTTKPEGKGTGLGLAIVAQMVEDHHGDIDVQSRLGVGTTFWVTIPLRQPE